MIEGEDLGIYKTRFKAKKKSYLILRHFFQKIDACGRLFIFTFIFRLGTFLDIWVCLAKQNGGGFTQVPKMQV